MAGSSLYEGWNSASTVLADNVFLSGNSIYAIAEGSSWNQAQASAERLGGNLVTINSAEENTYVFKNFGFEDDVAISSGYWIGLTDQESEGDWKWISSDDSSWSPYGWGQPGHEPNGNGDHAWVKVGFDHPGKSYAEYVEVHDNHWSEYEQPLWVERGPSWDDTGESGQGTNYGVAEIPYIRRGDSAYVVVEGPTWEEAEANANSLGGHLVSINDAEENDWLSTITYRPPEDTQASYWIGLTDRSVEGSWEWVSGEEVEFQNWLSGAPTSNDHVAGPEDFAVIHSNSDNPKWIDVANSNAFYRGWGWDSLGIAEIKIPAHHDSAKNDVYEKLEDF